MAVLAYALGISMTCILGYLLAGHVVREIMLAFHRETDKIGNPLTLPAMLTLFVLVIPSLLFLVEGLNAWQPPPEPAPHRLIVMAFEDGPTDRDVRIVNKLVEATKAIVLFPPGKAPMPAGFKHAPAILISAPDTPLQDSITRWIMHSEKDGARWNNILVLGDRKVGVYCQLHMRPDDGGYSALQIPDMIKHLETDRKDFLKIMPRKPKTITKFYGL